MAKYRKKPVIIEATQWFRNGDHPEDNSRTLIDPETGPFLTEGDIVHSFGRRLDVDSSEFCKLCGEIFGNHGWIDTLEGGHIVCPGDWIITGVKGEMYPCKPDIFAATYDDAE